MVGKYDKMLTKKCNRTQGHPVKTLPVGGASDGWGMIGGPGAGTAPIQARGPNRPEHRRRRGAGLARSDERGVAALFARGAKLSGALQRQNVYHTLQCAVERRAFLVGAKPTQQLSLRLVAARAVHGGNDMD